jgi:hypothetical protein
MQSGTEQVKLGVESTMRAGASLREIIQTSEAAGVMATAIATPAAAQQGATEEISSNIEQIAAITQGAVAGAKESAKAVHELSALAVDLQKIVAKFRLSRSEDASSATEPWPEPARPPLLEGQLGHRNHSDPVEDNAFSATTR